MRRVSPTVRFLADAANLHSKGVTRRRRKESDVYPGPSDIRGGGDARVCSESELGSPFQPLRGDLETSQGVAMKTARERAEEKREEKLELIREQVECGSLVIRQMTDEERQQYPPRPVEAKRPRGR
jgi:hypothetical protein